MLLIANRSAQVYEYTAVNRLRNRIKGPVSAMAVMELHAVVKKLQQYVIPWA